MNRSALDPYWRRILTVLAVIAIAAAESAWPGVYARLYAVPVAFLALYDGWLGGAAAATLSIVLLAAGPAHGAAAAVFIEGLALLGVGLLVGIVADRERHRRLRYQSRSEQLSAVCEKVQANFEGMKRAERLSAIGQLSAGLAHEIRNPLASISGAAEILQRSRNLEPKYAKCLEIITNECRRLNGLLTNFLNFARPRPPRFRMVDIDPILEHVVGLASHAIRAKTTYLEKHAAPNLPKVDCDPEQLEQVLLNLLINAIEASPEAGTVTLSALPTEGGVEIRVVDRGSGVAPANVDRLFDPFFTTKENGTGLGLPVAHQIVRQMGGSLQAQRNEGSGMTFSVILPPKHQEAYEPSTHSGSR